MHAVIYNQAVFASDAFEENSSSMTILNSVRCSVSSCSNTGSIRDDLYWTSSKNSLELIELSSKNKVSLA